MGMGCSSLAGTSSGAVIATLGTFTEAQFRRVSMFFIVATFGTASIPPISFSVQVLTIWQTRLPKAVKRKGRGYLKPNSLKSRSEKFVGSTNRELVAKAPMFLPRCLVLAPTPSTTSSMAKIGNMSPNYFFAAASIARRSRSYRACVLASGLLIPAICNSWAVVIKAIVASRLFAEADSLEEGNHVIHSLTRSRSKYLLHHWSLTPEAELLPRRGSNLGPSTSICD